MPAYTITYSDLTKPSIVINTGTVDFSTSVGLVGKDFPGYGPIVAENFLHLLENAASPTPPANPIEGQLWYDTSDPNNKKLMINDGSASGGLWYPANGIHQSVEAPTNVREGDMWIDTTFQQLKIFNSGNWILIGPEFSSVLQTGSYSELIPGTDAIDHFITKEYLDGNVIAILAQEEFTPLAVINGYDTLQPGINLKLPDLNTGVIPVFNGIATEAEALRVTSPSLQTISSNYFFRKDISQSLSFPLTVNNDSGIEIGLNSSTFLIQKSVNDGIISSIADSSRIKFQISKNLVSNTILTLDGGSQRVGINEINPATTLDVNGTFKVKGASSLLGNVYLNGTLHISSSTQIVGSFQADGSAKFLGTTTIVKSIIPSAQSVYDLGNSTLPFKRIWVDTVGTTSTVFNGRSASTIKLSASTVFSIAGHVITTATVTFDGSTGGLSKVFHTKLTNQAIDGQVSTSSSVSSWTLPISNGSSLFKITRANLLAGVPQQIVSGMIMPWPGISLPVGWVLCDGTSYTQSGTYSSLHSTIGTKFGWITTGTFQVPNLSSLNTTGTVVAIPYIIKV